MKKLIYSISITFICVGYSYSNEYVPKYKILKESFLTNEEMQNEWDLIPIESLTLSRSGCYGACPQYTTTLLKGGKAEFTGIAYTKLKGKYAGEIDLYRFALLTSYIERTGFMELQVNYQDDLPDGERVTLKFTMNGTEKIISDYGRRAPPEFQAFIALLESVESEIPWVKTKKH